MSFIPNKVLLYLCSLFNSSSYSLFDPKDCKRQIYIMNHDII